MKKLLCCVFAVLLLVMTACISTVRMLYRWKMNRFTAISGADILLRSFGKSMTMRLSWVFLLYPVFRPLLT